MGESERMEGKGELMREGGGRGGRGGIYSPLKAFAHTNGPVTDAGIGAFNVGVSRVSSASLISPCWSSGACSQATIRRIAKARKASTDSPCPAGTMSRTPPRTSSVREERH